MPLHLVNYLQLYMVLCTTKIAATFGTEYELKIAYLREHLRGITSTMISHRGKGLWMNYSKLDKNTIHNSDRGQRNVLPNVRKVKYF